jgi:DNA-binding NtrC family response regulator
VIKILEKYHWPGNVRELENVIERATVTCRSNTIEIENLPAELATPTAPRTPFQIDLNRPLPDLVKETIASLEKQYIQKALRKTHGHVGRCAKICGMSRRSITSKIAEYTLDKAAFQEQ